MTWPSWVEGRAIHYQNGFIYKWRYGVRGTVSLLQFLHLSLATCRLSRSLSFLGLSFLFLGLCEELVDDRCRGFFFHPRVSSDFPLQSLHRFLPFSLYVFLSKFPSHTPLRILAVPERPKSLTLKRKKNIGPLSWDLISNGKIVGARNWSEKEVELLP